MFLVSPYFPIGDFEAVIDMATFFGSHVSCYAVKDGEWSLAFFVEAYERVFIAGCG